MTNQLLFENKDNCWEAALLKDGMLFDYRKTLTGIAAEQIYLAKIDRVVRGMEAVFVKLTDKENGFLPYSEIKGRCAIPPRSGDKILVQVKKPPVQQKCAYLTCDITLAGRYVILLPYGHGCSVSRRIEDEKTVLDLEILGRKLKPEDMGIIMREESANAETEEIRDEITDLQNRWEHIFVKVHEMTAPCLLDEGQSLVEMMLRDTKCSVHEIITNTPDEFVGISVPVHYSPNPMTLHNISSKLEKSLKRKVWLRSGGNLVIDPCEAMTVFDVNSAKDLGTKKGMEDTTVRLNCEAAEEIARIIRLRGIGGIILIDFVDMQTEENRTKVRSALEEALRDDPVKTAIHGFTSLGLLEMTRKKTTAPLSQIQETPCPHCKGTGKLENKHE